MIIVNIKGVECIPFEYASELIESETGFRPAPSTIYKYIKEGKLPRTLPFKIGNRAFFSKDELQRCARENLIRYN